MKFVIFVVFSLNLFAYGQEFVPVCERTQQVQDEIVKKIHETVDSTINCTSANYILEYINVLDLKNKGITSLKVGDFAGLSSLKRLDLHNNKLSTLPPGLFSDIYPWYAVVKPLERVYLWGNSLSQKEKDRIKEELSYMGVDDLRF